MITEHSVWNTKTDSYISEHKASRRDPSRQYILDYLQSNSTDTILECGVGGGILIENIAERGLSIDYTGVDASSKFLGYVGARHPGVKLIEHDFDEVLPFSDGEFEIVYARHVLEHVKSYEIIREMARVASVAVIIVFFRPLQPEASINLKSHKGTYYNSYKQSDVEGLCKECFREYRYFACDGNDSSPAAGPEARNWILHCKK